MHAVLVRGLKDTGSLLFRSPNLLVDRVAAVYFALIHVDTSLLLFCSRELLVDRVACD